MNARRRFAEIAEQMVVSGALKDPEARSLTLPRVLVYDPAAFESDLDRPTGLVVAQVLAELRQTDQFRGKPAGFIENGGYNIVTTLDVRAQAPLEQIADETVRGSLMDGQPNNLQAAAVVVEPGTGRVLAYYGGHDGTGADYAGSYYAADGKAAGFGAHPPGQTFDVYTLAAALDAGISVKSVWNSPEAKQFPDRPADSPVRDFAGAPCQPRCSLVEATTASLNVPYYALAEKLRPATVIEMARDAGIDAMWVPDSVKPRPATSPDSAKPRPATSPDSVKPPPATSPDSASTERRRVPLRDQPGSAVSPTPFGTDVALGDYPVTVLDQANAMATFAAGGRRAEVHFVQRVRKDSATLIGPRVGPGVQVLNAAAVKDLTWTLAQDPSGQLSDGRASATKTGVGLLRTSQVETAHAWIVGYTANLAMAVWIGNQETEFPLRDSEGARVTGAGLPAQIYRAFMPAAHEALGLPKSAFADPPFGGSAGAGDG
jgi:membrane peptidoglycan carboxypeptidase